MFAHQRRRPKFRNPRDRLVKKYSLLLWRPRVERVFVIDFSGEFRKGFVKCAHILLCGTVLRF